MQAPQNVTPAKSPREKLLDLELEINARVFEREEPVRGFIVGLLSRAHVLFLGKKGAAKSMMGRLLCDAIVWEGIPSGFDPYFRTQLGRDSATDEVLGPVSAKGYEEDTYRRNTAHMLPEAKVALVEEIYKSNPTVLNRLLSIMNEGVFKNGSLPEQKVPLRLMVGSSNELPDERDDNLDAFHDRFLLRYDIGYLNDPKNVRRMMELANRPGEAAGTDPIAAILTEREVLEAIEEAAAVDVSGVFDALDELLAEIAHLEIEVSDRRRFGLVGLVKAQAYLAGRQAAQRADLSILAHALWEDPEQIPDVKSRVLKAAHPRAARAQEEFDAVSDSYREAMEAAAAAARANTDEANRAKTAAGIDANVALQNATRKLFEQREEAKDSGAHEAAERIDALLSRIGDMNAEVTDKCLGI